MLSTGRLWLMMRTLLIEQPRGLLMWYCELRHSGVAHIRYFAILPANPNSSHPLIQEIQSTWCLTLTSLLLSNPDPAEALPGNVSRHQLWSTAQFHRFDGANYLDTAFLHPHKAKSTGIIFVMVYLNLKPRSYFPPLSPCMHHSVIRKSKCNRMRVCTSVSTFHTTLYFSAWPSGFPIEYSSMHFTLSLPPCKCPSVPLPTFCDTRHVDFWVPLQAAEHRQRRYSFVRLLLVLGYVHLQQPIHEESDLDSISVRPQPFSSLTFICIPKLYLGYHCKFVPACVCLRSFKGPNPFVL